MTCLFGCVQKVSLYLAYCKNLKTVRCCFRLDIFYLLKWRKRNSIQDI